jgi:hypothetical protein
VRAPGREFFADGYDLSAIGRHVGSIVGSRFRWHPAPEWRRATGP